MVLQYLHISEKENLKMNFHCLQETHSNPIRISYIVSLSLLETSDLYPPGVGNEICRFGCHPSRTVESGKCLNHQWRENEKKIEARKIGLQETPKFWSGKGEEESITEAEERIGKEGKMTKEKKIKNEGQSIWL